MSIDGESSVSARPVFISHASRDVELLAHLLTCFGRVWVYVMRITSVLICPDSSKPGPGFRRPHSGGIVRHGPRG